MIDESAVFNPRQTYNAVQANIFISDVLADLLNHKLNMKIPEDFRDRIPDFRDKLQEISEIEDEYLLVVRLQQLMDVYTSSMELLEVEDQIYFNMIYQVSEYKNITAGFDSELSSDDESDIDSDQEVDRSMSDDDDDKSIDSVSSDWTTDSDESQRESDDEAYYSEPSQLEEARATYNKINREFIILKVWLEQANKMLEDAEAKMEEFQNDKSSANYKEAEDCLRQAEVVQGECSEKFVNKRIALNYAKARLKEELKEHWQEKAGEGNDPLVAYFNSFLEMGEVEGLFETELNHLCFKAISSVFATNQVGIHRAIFEARQKSFEAEQKVLDAHVKFKQEAQKLIDTDDIFSLDTKRELREARDDYSDAKMSMRRAVIVETYLSEMLERGIDFDEVLSIVNWKIDFLERRCNSLYRDKCYAEAEALRSQQAYERRVNEVHNNLNATVKDNVQALEFQKSLTSGELWKQAKRFQKEHREAVTQLEEVDELKNRIETFRDEEKEVVEVDSAALRSFFDNTFKSEKQGVDLRAETLRKEQQEDESMGRKQEATEQRRKVLECSDSPVVKDWVDRNRARQEQETAAAQRQKTQVYYLGGLLLVASAAVCIYLARNHESTTALRSCVSSAIEKFASTTIGEFAGNVLSCINNSIYR